TTAAVQDAQGNTVTGYAGTVHFTSSDAQAVLPADFAFQSADSGVHTFVIAYRTAGVQSAAASDALGAAGATTQTTVSAASAAQLALAAPASAAAGVPFSAAVTAKDAFGN